MERAFDSKVMLKLWVKVKSGWSDDIRPRKPWGWTRRATNEHGAAEPGCCPGKVTATAGCWWSSSVRSSGVAARS